jgi:DNA-binding NarL/FixJ family response regulator
MIDLALHDAGLAGLPLIRTIRAHDPRARLIVFSMHADPVIVARALEAGAAGYLLKDTSSEELVQAVHKVAAGGQHLSEALAVQVALAGAGGRKNPLAELTPRELQTLSLLARGMSYGRIAEELNVSYKTVVNVCYQLRQKLDVRTLPELIRLSVQLAPAAS